MNAPDAAERVRFTVGEHGFRDYQRTGDRRIDAASQWMLSDVQADPRHLARLADAIGRRLQGAETEPYEFAGNAFYGQIDTDGVTLRNEYDESVDYRYSPAEASTIMRKYWDFLRADRAGPFDRQVAKAAHDLGREPVLPWTLEQTAAATGAVARPDRSPTEPAAPQPIDREEARRENEADEQAHKRTVPDALPDAAVQRIADWCASFYPHEVHRDRRLEYEVDGSLLTIFEYAGPERTARSQLRYLPQPGVPALWRLFIADHDGRWRPSNPIGPNEDPVLLLAAAADPLHPLWKQGEENPAGG